MRTSGGKWLVKVKTRQISGFYFAFAEAVRKFRWKFSGRTHCREQLNLQVPGNKNEMKNQEQQSRGGSGTQSTVTDAADVVMK